MNDDDGACEMDGVKAVATLTTICGLNKGGDKCKGMAKALDVMVVSAHAFPFFAQTVPTVLCVQ